MLTESFSSPGHRKGSPAASPNADVLKDTPLPALFFTALPQPPVACIALPPPYPCVILQLSLSVIKVNFEFVCCVFRSSVVLCKVAVGFDVVTKAAMKGEKRHNVLEQYTGTLATRQ